MSNNESDDYYEVLGVARNASEDEIKKAYKKCALRLHPDRNPNDPTAKEKFQKVSEAFEVLSDPQQRAAYNRYGKEGARMNEQPFRGGGAHHVDPEELFRQMFGQGFAPGGNGFPGGGNFYFHVGGMPGGVPGMRRRPQAQQQPFPDIQIPPVIQQLMNHVPPPLLAILTFFLIFVGLQLFSTIFSVATQRMHIIMPIMWAAPERLRAPLILLVLLLGFLEIL